MYVGPYDREMIHRFRPSDDFGIAPACAHGNPFAPVDRYSFVRLEENADEIIVHAHKPGSSGPFKIRLGLHPSTTCKDVRVVVDYYGMVNFLVDNGGCGYTCGCAPTLEHCSNGRILAG